MPESIPMQVRVPRAELPLRGAAVAVKADEPEPNRNRNRNGYHARLILGGGAHELSVAVDVNPVGVDAVGLRWLAEVCLCVEQLEVGSTAHAG